MTLRVTIEIIPFGNEDKKYTVDVLNISNMGTTDFIEHEYVIERNEYKKYTNNTPRVFHNRNDGALRLIEKAINRII